MVHAVVPAAGRSTRLGRNKALVPLLDRPVIDHVVAALRAAGAPHPVVVGAPGDDPLAARCRELKVAYTVNPEPARGMLTSILAGLAAVPDLEEAPLVVLPVDYPAVAPQSIARLLQALSDGRVAVPCCNGRRGHPLVLRAEVVPAVAALDPRVGLRQLLEREPAIEVEIDDRGTTVDLDSWADHALLSTQIPTLRRSSSAATCPPISTDSAAT